MYANASHFYQVCNGFGIFERDRRRRYLRRIIRITQRTGMNEAVLRTARGAHENTYRSKPGRRARTAAAISYRLPVSIDAEAAGGQLLVELVVEKNDLSLHLL